MQWFGVAYFVLAVLTAVFLIGLALVWRKTSLPHFVLGLALVYYYSLFGAWGIVAMKEHGTASYSLDYLEASLFPITIDENYVLALLVYGVFVLSLLFAVTLLVPARNKILIGQSRTVAIHYWRLLLIATVCFCASLAIEWQGLQSALDEGVSAYSITRFEDNPFYTIHQIFNRTGLAALAIGIAGAFALRRKNFGIAIGYLPVTLAWIAFLFLIGNRNEMLMAGIAGFLWYFSLGGRLKAVPVAIVVLCGFFILRLTEATRGEGLEIATTDVSETLLSADFWNPFAVASGSESQAAHMSMYGVLSHNVDFTYGSSILYFVSSFVPRLIWSDRPPDSYTLYTNATMVSDEHGYNIHLATGWYLNFGLPGVIVGAILVALVWVGVFRMVLRNQENNSRWAVMWCCSFCFTSAFMAALMRNGPEGMKGMIVEAVIIPLVVAWIGTKDIAPQSIAHRPNNPDDSLAS